MSLRMLTRKVAENIGQSVVVSEQLADLTRSTFAKVARYRAGEDQGRRAVTSPAYTAGVNVTEGLEALAARQPSAPLLHSPGYPSITYWKRCDADSPCPRPVARLAIARGDVVAGFVASRPRMALACLALPSSSTFAPLSGSLQVAEYTALLERLRATAVLVPEAPDHPLRAAARALGLAHLDAVDDPSDTPGMFTLEAAELNPRRGVENLGSADFAYVVVTSGTTGRPGSSY